MQFQTEITAAAAKRGLDPMLVGGIVSHESSFNSYAWNPESAYRYYWNVRTRQPFRAVTPAELLDEKPPIDFSCLAGDPDQEWWAQSASWGLMQIMGAVARDQGFRGSYLTELVDPVVNLDLGCAHLQSLMTWAKGDVDRALAAYNGGKSGNFTKPYRNQQYATLVIAARSNLK